ncbi:Dihydropteroate synthase-like protein [Cladochytrium replicatum]|nr:Dihydropteroate synthase-like protein [Cladochytrium replicatum]
MDKIIVQSLVVQHLGVDSWERDKKQPLSITLTLWTDVGVAGDHDLLSDSINYSTATKEVERFSETTKCRSIEAMACGIARFCLNKFPTAAKVCVRIEKPRALLHAACAGVEVTRDRSQIDALQRVAPRVLADLPRTATIAAALHGVASKHAGELARWNDTIFIRDLELSTIIGVHAWEREEKQRVIVNVTVHTPHPMEFLVDRVPTHYNYHTLVRAVTAHVEESKYLTVEAMSTALAKICANITKCPVTAKTEKPSAIMYAKSAGVEVSRGPSEGVQDIFFPLALRRRSEPGRIVGDAASSKGTASNEEHIAYIALGSNLGDRLANIESALKKLESGGQIKVLDTSFLYESAPMYLAEQPLFLNAACKVSTTLNPDQLLDVVKKIEKDLGRTPTTRNGPREIDLDILFFDSLEVEKENLTIPHPLISEREFVLRPLCDIAPQLRHPKLSRTCSKMLALLQHGPEGAPVASTVTRVTPVGKKFWPVGQRTYLMGILNVTPDSFSDGGKFNTVERAVEQAQRMIEYGVDVIDVGGQSTRPNADEVPEDEELSRVVPVIRALRSAGIDCPISVDTYRSGVAKAAIEAGADYVNDVTGGLYDSRMLGWVAGASKPVCLMHMRGTPKTMMQLNQYENNDVVGVVGKALEERVAEAMGAGVRRWNITIDPGVGFAKDSEQSVTILKGLRSLVKEDGPLRGFPLLVGPSRKGFVGKLTKKQDPEERVFGTAAACTAAIAGGADILRVHDVKEMRDVVLVADECFRNK